MENIIKLGSINASNNFGQLIGKNLIGGEIIELRSDLGGGKTTLVNAILQATNSKDKVSSPSFALINQYKTSKLSIYHLDLYRLKEAGIMKNEVEEILKDKNNVLILEWADLLTDLLPPERLIINIKVDSETSRIIELNYPKKLEYLFKK